MNPTPLPAEVAKALADYKQSPVTYLLGKLKYELGLYLIAFKSFRPQVSEDAGKELTIAIEAFESMLEFYKARERTITSENKDISHMNKNRVLREL